MKQGRIVLSGVVMVIVFALIVGSAVLIDEGEAKPTDVPNPVLTVAMAHAEMSTLPIRVPATGNIAAWQEASIGAESDGLRLTEIRVNVGDAVERGQVLALFDAGIVQAELDEARAAVAQAEATRVEADANAQRATSLAGSGALSAQQINQYVIGAMVAKARLAATQAAEKRTRLRLAQTRVLAPSDGIITSRVATVGAVVPAGQELFRLIKDGRLEWRAAVAITHIEKLAPGQIATIDIQGHEPIRGELRMVAPAINTETHDGLVYVDLPRDRTIRAGAFARGYVEIGDGLALTVPQSAVSLRDGFHYVMQVGAASNVVMKKVDVGRRAGDRIEIIEGLATSDAIIASGHGFLSEGDTVRVVGDAPRAAPDRPVPTHAASNADARAGSGS
jgi:RND family efflux transporter MFP subunit